MINDFLFPQGTDITKDAQIRDLKAILFFVKL